MDLSQLDAVSIIGSDLRRNTGSHGGGISVLAASNGGGIMIDDSVFAFNSATYGGGLWGIFNDGSVVVTESRFTANQADVGAGASLGLSGDTTAEILAAQFIGNEARADEGGGLFADVGTQSQLTMERSLMSGNTASNGGGVYLDVRGQTRIVESIIHENVGLGFGGGIGVTGNGDLYVTATTISENLALEGDGGGIDVDSDFRGRVIIDSSTLAENTGYEGGGINMRVSNRGFLAILNSTLSGNTASRRGGGVYFRSTDDEGQVSILSSTIVENSLRQSDYGGGLWIRGAEIGINNSIVAGNDADFDPDLHLAADASLSSFSQFNLFGVMPDATLDDTNQYGDSISPLDPRLAPLADNGGPTPTHALLEDSPAINTGSPEGVLSTVLSFDQRGEGFARILDGVTDIGAFESGENVDFEVVDRRADETFTHGRDGTVIQSNPLDSGNRNATGITMVGSQKFVVDRNDSVYVYNESQQLVEQQELSELRSPEGITTNGFDLWVVDRSSDQVYFYQDAVFGLPSNGLSTSTFRLSSENRNPMGITFGVLDGEEYLWVVDDRGGTERVFRYRTDGTLEGSWEFDVDANSRPRGIAVDPTNPTDVLMIDSRQDLIIRFDGAARATTGTEFADETIAIDASASDPQGLAQPLTAPVATAMRSMPLGTLRSQGESENAIAMKTLVHQFAVELQFGYRRSVQQAFEFDEFTLRLPQ